MARNFCLAVCRKETCGFIGKRVKFGRIFPFEEYHWDNEYFATVKPLEELPETLPASIYNEEKLCYCENCGVLLEAKQGAKPQTFVPFHKEDTVCLEPKWGTTTDNKALLDWLIEMEKKYPKAEEDTWGKEG